MRIALIGYGKMGHMIERIARQRGHEIVSVIDVDNQEEFSSESFASADVAIEFTSPKAAYGNYLRAFEHNVKVVSGSTGWLQEHRSDVERMCQEEGKTLFWASNFSVGVAIFSALNRYLAKIMDGFGGYDVRMQEAHHIHKQDAPSGTAISLAEDIIANLGRMEHWAKGSLTFEGKTIQEATQAQKGDLVINSVREGEVPGTHTITYSSPADDITIEHRAHSREGFALGAVLAAEYTLGHTGLLTIDDMFSF